MLPLTVNVDNVPTDVMLACALPVTVPAVVAESAVPAEVAYVALATAPTTLAPVKLLSVEPLPMTYAPDTLAVVVMLAVELIVFEPKLANNVVTLLSPYVPANDIGVPLAYL